MNLRLMARHRHWHRQPPDFRVQQSGLVTQFCERHLPYRICSEKIY